MFNRNEIVEKRQDKNSQDNYIFELRKYKSDIIGDSKIFINFSSKMERREE